MINFYCKQCKSAFMDYPSREGRRLFCSKICHSYFVRGSGKRYVRLGNHKYLHRQIMEEYLGRQLSFNEVVHHKNHDKKDNRIENLELVTRGEHGKLHHSERMAKRGVDAKTHKLCHQCKKAKTFDNFYKAKKNGRDWFTSKCISCRSKWHRNYYENRKKQLQEAV